MEAEILVKRVGYPLKRCRKETQRENAMEIVATVLGRVKRSGRKALPRNPIANLTSTVLLGPRAVKINRECWEEEYNPATIMDLLWAL